MILKTKRLCASAAFIALSTALSGQALGQDNGDHLKSEKAKIFNGSALSSNASSKSAIAAFIAAQTGETGTGPALVEDSRFQGRNGVTHIRLHQEIDGIPVHGSYVKAASRQGRLTHLVERTAPNKGKRNKATISAGQAINIAVGENFGAGKSTDFFHKAPSASKVYIARPSGALDEGYLVESWSAADNQLFHTLVDGKGRIVDNESRTNNDSYLIYPDHPGNSSATLVSNPADAVASPNGWLSGGQTTLQIQGNNVSSYLDRDANNAPDGGGSVVTDEVFDTGADLLQAPTFSVNQEAAVQNLFYFNNLIHDDLYHHGFVEATRNFQENNFGRGGAGGDPVDAEAQDGSGTNNANFSTPGDGANPRMQMFLWTATNPGRDGDLDSDIIWHEYGHGLTWRMIGSMSGSVSGAIGEGMSDVLAILHNNDDVVGEYSTNDSNGIRSAPYTNYTRTIGDFGNSSVHFDGEIYAATIWRLAELSNAGGMDNEAVMDVLVDGMNFTPAGPGYLDMRDGILAAASSDYDCTVWQAFADFGMGDGASFNIRTGGNPRNRIQINESFTVPSVCNGGGGGNPEPPTGDSVSVSGLTGSSVLSGRRNWTATATISIIDDAGAAASGVAVAGSFSSGGGASCTTDNSGSCSVSTGGLRTNRDSSVTYTINTLNGNAATGSPLSITINRP